MRLRLYEGGRTAVESSEAVHAEAGFAKFKIKACGICGSDISRVFSNGAYYYPIVLGHEFSGIVEDSLDPSLIGKRACVYPILPCGKCEFCKEEKWANCSHYDYYGSRRDGGMQDYLSIKETNLIFLDDNVTYEAGAMIEPCAVTLHAVKKADINNSSVVRVYGAGTIGLLCAMWAKVYGAKEVYIYEPDNARMTFAEKLGFKVSSAECPNIVIEASGTQGALNAAISDIRAFGKIVIVGNTLKDMTISKENYSLILRKQLIFLGSWNSDLDSNSNEWQECVDSISRGIISPEVLITHKFPLAESEKAFALISEKKELYNKIMVVM